MGKHYLSARNGGLAGKILDVKDTKVSHFVPQRCEKAISFFFSPGLLYIKKQSRLGDNA